MEPPNLAWLQLPDIVRNLPHPLPDQITCAPQAFGSQQNLDALLSNSDVLRSVQEALRATSTQWILPRLAAASPRPAVDETLGLVA
ncbi:hypothetical protein HaLaN_10432, partial [Haematococcus lacustris]